MVDQQEAGAGTNAKESVSAFHPGSSANPEEEQNQGDIDDALIRNNDEDLRFRSQRLSKKHQMNAQSLIQSQEHQLVHQQDLINSNLGAFTQEESHKLDHDVVMIPEDTNAFLQDKIEQNQRQTSTNGLQKTAQYAEMDDEDMTNALKGK